jgi:acetylornithine/LysW-gamma-L-lysine aminotransferase
MDSLAIGEHTSTFGGNPVVCAAGSATIDVLRDENLVQHAAEMGEYFKQELLGVQREGRMIREVRGLGLMLAAELRFDVHSIILSALQEGVLMLDAGRNVLRFLPPLCIEQAHIDKTSNVLRGILEREEIAKLPG